jgi:outer membrane lipoprotein-sorting protein
MKRAMASPAVSIPAFAFRAVVLCLVLLPFAAALERGGHAAPPGQSVALDQPAGTGQETLARLKDKAGQVQSIYSGFVQERRLSIFSQTLRSRGVFAFGRPASLRWEYLEPVRSGFALSGEAGKRWNELSGESREFQAGRDPIMQLVAAQILLWTTLDLETLGKTFRIEVESGSPAVLRFTPLTPDRGPVTGMRITFTPDDSAIAVIEIMEKDGDSTTIRFTDTRLNTVLDDTLFTRQ